MFVLHVEMSHVMRSPIIANNKGAVQHAHPRSLISAFVVRYLDITMFYLYLLNPKFKTLASLCSWAGRFESTLVANLEDRFSRDEAH